MSLGKLLRSVMNTTSAQASGRRLDSHVSLLPCNTSPVTKHPVLSFRGSIVALLMRLPQSLSFLSMGLGSTTCYEASSFLDLQSLGHGNPDLENHGTNKATVFTDFTSLA